MKWAIVAAAVVIVANGVVLVSERRERSAPATHTPIEVCAADLLSAGNADEPPAIRLAITADSPRVVPGLDADGLRALGFNEASVAAAGHPRDSTFHWPRARPAWVRIGQRGDSFAQFLALEVAPRREALTADSASLILRGLVSFREQPGQPVPDSMAAGAGHDHAALKRELPSGVLYAVVSEVIPSRLHLDREQSAALRAAIPDSGGCSVRRRVRIANGASGGVWVEGVE
jgi:hypothetical protein